MNEIVRPEKTPDAASSYTVHRSRLQVNKHGPRDIFTTCMHTGWIQGRQNSFLEFYLTKKENVICCSKMYYILHTTTVIAQSVRDWVEKQRTLGSSYNRRGRCQDTLSAPPWYP